MRVLLAVDEDAASEEAVNKVGERRWAEGTFVRVLHVVGNFVPPAQELWFDAGGDPDRAREEIRERSTELTERVGGWLREQGLAVETAVRDGEPGRAVVEEAKEWGADLVVIGTRGHGGLRRLLEGSVSRYVIDHAPCPVEVIHSQGEKEGEDG